MLFGFIAPAWVTHAKRARVIPFVLPSAEEAIGGHALTSENKLPDKPKKGAAAQSKNRDMGSALRSVYQKTVDESVPDDLLALLGKLD